METAELIYPGKILEGPDQNIYIFDSQDAYIKVFSPEGKFIRKLGGKGEGPGQFKRADGADFGFTPERNQIWFTEYFGGHQWMTFIDINGNLKSTLKYNLQGTCGILGADIVNEDSIYLWVDRPGRTDRKHNIYYYYFRAEIVSIDGKGNQRSLLLSREYPERISFIRDGGDMAIPFTPKFLWEVNETGEVLFTDGTGKSLEIYSGNGKAIGEILLPLPEPERVTPKDLKDWRMKMKAAFVGNKISWYKRFGKVIEKYSKSIFEYKPVILDFQVTPEGNLMLKCRGKKDSVFRYILARRDGGKLSGAESDLRRIRITRNYVTMVRLSEDEDYQIALIKRSGTDKEDLEKALKINR